jgi:hypothetical protein
VRGGDTDAKLSHFDDSIQCPDKLRGASAKRSFAKTVQDGLMTSFWRREQTVELNPDRRVSSSNEHGPDTLLNPAPQPGNVTFEGCDRREKNLVRDKPCGGPIKEHTGSIRSCPAQGIEPSIEPELQRGIGKVFESAMAAYFGGMIPACFTLAVINEAAQLLDPELPGDAVDNTLRHIGQIFQKCAQKSRCAELDGEAQPGMVTPMRVDDCAIAIVKEKVPGQLLLRGFPAEAAITLPLFLGEKADRHKASFWPGEVFA